MVIQYPQCDVAGKLRQYKEIKMARNRRGDDRDPDESKDCSPLDSIG